jgi:hypothetical protein
MVARDNGERTVSRRSAIRTAGLAALAGGLSMAASGTPVAGQQASVSGIAGTWRMRLPPGPNRIELDYLAVFIPGGVFLGLDSPVEPGESRPGQDSIDYPGQWAGQWLQLPDGHVRVTSIQLNYDRRAVVISEEWASYTLTYNGTTDTISGTWEWRETRRDGTLLFSTTGTIEGTRVKVEV